ncbi:MAG: class I SAM-dependent methyltransferase [Alphaproteobacteria bacterium]|nr:class I SAM-dependent methyltransferase [Alphaproteobacteria bacterium]
MSAAVQLRHGEFTGLAEDYAAYRPGYAESVLDGVLGLLKRPASELDAADVGAGTGIWTRMLAGRGFRRLTAIEPNDDMRRAGRRDSQHLAIDWRKGSGERTGLPDASVDLVSMASSFHWVDFEAGLREFHRLLRPGGRFIALWNPRLVEANPLLVEIEAMLGDYMPPGARRVSSGRSGLADTLNERLWARPWFDDVIYLESRHRARQTPAQYLGAWRSVNDIRVQLGPARFAAFLDAVARRIEGIEAIETTYLTRAWAARPQKG